MKTPDESVKNDLEHTAQQWKGWSIEAVVRKAIAYIEQLEEQVQLMKIQMHGDCGVCKHRRYAHVTPSGPRFTGPCYPCMQKESRPNWEYEGLPEVESR